MILWLLACTPEPTSFDECTALSGLEERTVCRADFSIPLPKSNGELEERLASIADETERDLLLVELAVRNPSAGTRLCARATTTLGQRQCEQVVGRPHLGHHKRE
ncbi:MAG: hypothetical protein GY913_31110 [Proteobacteria bacterium]|nr:hypothetical protein [Pseudomonadota bacterium]MCP4921368.1 hypothetical protein [Pseudomonadota bacterium]